MTEDLVLSREQERYRVSMAVRWQKVFLSPSTPQWGGQAHILDADGLDRV